MISFSVRASVFAWKQIHRYLWSHRLQQKIIKELICEEYKVP